MPRTKFTNCYDILGISPDANLKDINSAYKKLALKHHPDKTGSGENSSYEFQKIQEAVEILRDPSSRRKHDDELGRTRRVYVNEQTFFASGSWKPYNATFTTLRNMNRYMYSYAHSVHMDPNSEESKEELARCEAERKADDELRQRAHFHQGNTEEARGEEEEAMPSTQVRDDEDSERGEKQGVGEPAVDGKEHYEQDGYKQENYRQAKHSQENHNQKRYEQEFYEQGNYDQQENCAQDSYAEESYSQDNYEQGDYGQGGGNTQEFYQQGKREENHEEESYDQENHEQGDCEHGEYDQENDQQADDEQEYHFEDESLASGNDEPESILSIDQSITEYETAYQSNDSDTNSLFEMESVGPSAIGMEASGADEIANEETDTEDNDDVFYSFSETHSTHSFDNDETLSLEDELSGPDTNGIENQSGEITPFIPYFNAKLNHPSGCYAKEDLHTELNGIVMETFCGWLEGVRLTFPGAKPSMTKNDPQQCLHLGFWTKEYGCAECETCHRWMPIYTLTCPGCDIKACVGCKFQHVGK